LKDLAIIVHRILSEGKEHKKQSGRDWYYPPQRIGPSESGGWNNEGREVSNLGKANMNVLPAYPRAQAMLASKPHIQRSDKYAPKNFDDGHAHQPKVSRSGQARVGVLKVFRKCNSTAEEIYQGNACKSAVNLHPRARVDETYQRSQLSKEQRLSGEPR